VHGRDRSVVTGVHACSMSRHSAPADLADDDASGRMRRQFSHELALRDFAASFDVDGRGLEPHDVGLLELELGGVLDRDDPLGIPG